MLDIKKLLTKLIQANIPEDVSSNLTAGTNCNLGSYCYAYKFGKFCLVNLNLQITGSISSGATLVNGLPKAKNRSCFAAARSGQVQAAAMRIAANSTSITADGAISNTGYYDGTLLYVIA